MQLLPDTHFVLIAGQRAEDQFIAHWQIVADEQASAQYR